MGRFTALKNPALDRQIESHLQRIVEAVTSRLEPQAVVLRGSFGRGEGSVWMQGSEIRFLSDYEIEVIIPSPACRGILRELSGQLTDELGVETSLRWQRPDFLTRMRLGPFVLGETASTIAHYELRYGSQTICGRDYFKIAPEIDPKSIRLDSGLYLLLNRMAESLLHIQPQENSGFEGLSSYYWINKTILACAEALLLIWGQYHYSYEERGRRFQALAAEKLGFFPDGGAMLADLVKRATEYKLRPRLNLYPHPVTDTWRMVYPEVERVFRHIIEEVLDFPVGDYNDFPPQYLKRTAILSRRDPLAWRVVAKLLDLYRSLRIRKVPPGIFKRQYLYQIVYANVPLLFLAQFTENYIGILSTSRKWMALLGGMSHPSLDVNQEKEYLTKRLAWFWKVYCHG